MQKQQEKEDTLWCDRSLSVPAWCLGAQCLFRRSATLVVKSCNSRLRSQGNVSRLCRTFAAPEALKRLELWNTAFVNAAAIAQHDLEFSAVLAESGNLQDAQQLLTSDAVHECIALDRALKMSDPAFQQDVAANVLHQALRDGDGVLLQRVQEDVRMHNFPLDRKFWKAAAASSNGAVVAQLFERSGPLFRDQHTAFAMSGDVLFEASMLGNALVVSALLASPILSAVLISTGHCVLKACMLEAARFERVDVLEILVRAHAQAFAERTGRGNSELDDVFKLALDCNSAISVTALLDCASEAMLPTAIDEAEIVDELTVHRMLYTAMDAQRLDILRAVLKHARCGNVRKLSTNLLIHACRPMRLGGGDFDCVIALLEHPRIYITMKVLRHAANFQSFDVLDYMLAHKKLGMRAKSLASLRSSDAAGTSVWPRKSIELLDRAVERATAQSAVRRQRRAASATKALRAVLAATADVPATSASDSDAILDATAPTPAGPTRVPRACSVHEAASLATTTHSDFGEGSDFGEESASDDNSSGSSALLLKADHIVHDQKKRRRAH